MRPEVHAHIGARMIAGALLLLCGLQIDSSMAQTRMANAAPAVTSAPIPTTTQLIAEALAYEHGEGVTKDQRQAALLYCRAARDGDPEAQFSLGWMYANGRGVAHDDAVASSLFALAAAAGHAHAQRLLALVGSDRGPLPDCMRPPPPSPPGRA